MTHSTKKVYDCFCYFNEDLVLEIRLETLFDYVDYFVISEAVYTQTGISKPLNFNIEKFSKYKSKIRYLVVDHYPEGEMSAWKNEHYQRNYLINGLYDANDDDLIIISDLDEIPRPELIALYQPEKYKRGDFKQNAYAYKLNNLCMIDHEPLVWDGTKITTYHYIKSFFKSMTAVRHYKSSGLFRSLKRTWFRKFGTQPLERGGWHFTWILTPENIILKMNAIADQQAIKESHKNIDYIQNKIKKGEDILDSKSTYVRQEIIEPNFPAWLVLNKEKYKEFLA